MELLETPKELWNSITIGKTLLLGVQGLGALLIIKLIVWYFRRRKAHSIFKEYNIVGPKPHFLYGNLHELRAKENPVEVISSYHKKFGKHFGYFLGGTPYLAINDIEMAKVILIKESADFINRERPVFNSEPFIDSLIYLKDQRWKHVRSIMTPIFSSNKVRKLVPIMDKKVNAMVSTLEERSKTVSHFDISITIQALTLDIIGESVLAMQVNCLQNENDPFLTSAREFFRYANSPALRAALLFPFLGKILDIINNHLLSAQMVKLTLDHLKKVIEHAKKMPNNADIKPNTIIQLFMDVSEGTNLPNVEKEKLLNRREMIANIYILLLAGFETTANALCYTIFHLVNHPDIQEKVYEEAKRVLKEGEEMSYEIINELKYTEQVLSESMRLLPPVCLFVSRECAKTTTINGITIPKGINVQVSIWDIHHDPELWEDPWTFDPERFSSENKQYIKPMAYLPFGSGPRVCLGMKMAMMEAKLAIAKLVLNFKISAGEKFENPLSLICPTVIINPENGIDVSLSKRD